jgi:hypothetical protein
MSTKRRLSLLPEVLPAPQRSEKSSARQRTLQRMKVLAALGAASIAAGCGKVTGDDTTSRPADGGLDGGEDAYGVVDPIPRPSCFDTSPRPTVSAAYVTPAGDAGADAETEPDGGVDAGELARRVEVTIGFDRETDVVFESSASADVPILETSMSSTGGRLLLAVPESRSTATVTLRFSCTSNGPGTLRVHLTLGSSVTVTTDDS